MNVPARAELRPEPNVTPMIDVMLVLLIIFMTVAPLLATGLKATPPTARHLTDRPEEVEDAVIGLDAAGRLYFDKRPIDESELRRRLAARFASRPEDRVVYLRADNELPYESVQDIMELASEEGAHVVGLIASPPPPAASRP